MPDLGQVQYQFNRSYIWTNPNSVSGLGLWRDINVPPEPSSVIGLFAVLPIVDDYDATTETSKLSFTIDRLDDIDVTENSSYLKTMLAQVRRPPESGSPLASLPKVQASLPIVSQSSARVVVIGFDITELPYVDIDPARKYSVKVNSYNGNKPVSISATVPIVEETAGNIVDLSFDITALDYA